MWLDGHKLKASQYLLPVQHQLKFNRVSANEMIHNMVHVRLCSPRYELDSMFAAYNAYVFSLASSIMCSKMVLFDCDIQHSVIMFRYEQGQLKL